MVFGYCRSSGVFQDHFQTIFVSCSASRPRLIPGLTQWICGCSWIDETLVWPCLAPCTCVMMMIVIGFIDTALKPLQYQINYIIVLSLQGDFSCFYTLCFHESSSIRFRYVPRLYVCVFYRDCLLSLGMLKLGVMAWALIL